ncbi:flagellar protein export ATPase FliI [Ancylobacter lacus]|uniref:flagellar protein export ATPase FliI n=1 Tax=Ancylobacter lacus TaxID=2579970 RepID=UPI001BCE74C9|nr:flagellar protein export ATPase FliI [Ancylobacter lacus]MBS7537955.1 flagellar protein export ATPase FliI [Ancylobacter lacus]
MTNALLKLHDEVLAGLEEVPLVRVGGSVCEVTPTYLRVNGLSQHLRLGERVSLQLADRAVIGEVVRLDTGGATVKPFDERTAIGIGAEAWRAGALAFRPHSSWKGRVISALGLPLDGKGSLPLGEWRMPLDGEPPDAMSRARIEKPLRTGVRVIDLFTPMCQGQRLGIFAGSGVGKSTLLSMLARCEGFDTVVVALVGERGREVREFLEGPLAPNRHRAVVVVATSDESAMVRRLAPQAGLAVAEYFRDRGESVLLIVDSVTRYAHAARDVALAAGEPAVARGYAPSVFSALPRLLERAGPGLEGTGSISAVFSVLVDGDDHNDPVADAIRGTLDGHIVLDRAIADQGRFPAVNILGSVSRLADLVWSHDQRELIRKLRSLISRFEDTRDLRLLGGYTPGSDHELDQAVAVVPKIYDALRQLADAPPSRDAFAELAQAIRG